LDNPDSDKFYTLPEAFNVLGRERYGEEWTGDQLGARNRPPPEPPPPRTFDAADWKRRNTTSFARAAVLLANKEDYQKESAAYQRRRQVRAELRRILYYERAPAELFNAHDGVRISVLHTHWFADIFTFCISSGMAELADPFTSSRPTDAFTPPPTYKGLVLIDRHQFDLAIKDYVASAKETTGEAGVHRDGPLASFDHAVVIDGAEETAEAETAKDQPSTPQRNQDLQKRAAGLRKEHRDWPKWKIAKHIADTNDVKKIKGLGNLSADAIEREIRLPRVKKKKGRRTP